ncbi:hypothetical protein EJ02DRAFT_399790 [Clathrospora elynae]|uniref:Zn(2)-C6 fungal-type domain-containing protein n=1 Tax=Clathrospora elynae TaxID=706981 RepID=A0A6A5SUA1_9PLEO|nr:hypothetical protein EJ02DRAFT_399790 [Clathrospora elynae]
MQQESPLTEHTPASRGSSQAFLVASTYNNNDEGASRPPTITRKSHRKSRAGCRNCKTRRIKCDETKPHCANCKRRQVRCGYPNTTTTSDLNSGDLANDRSRPGDLQISDIELTYHWITSTSHSLSAWASGAARWQSIMGDVAFEHNHVLHLLFALTALHLATCRPTRCEEYTATAEHHYERALAQVTREIVSIGPSNCDAVLVSVQLICFVSWARGPQAGEYLAFGKQGRSEWLVMFRGIRTTLESLGRDQFAKTHAPAVRAKDRLLPPLDEPFEYEKQLQGLREHVAYVSEPAERDDNARAIGVLHECYSSRYESKDAEYHVAFAWLYRMSDDFLNRLQQRDPLPLVIYAYFVVLMHDIERFWYMKGWTHHVMGGILEALPKEHRVWIRWPVAMVGWIAP